MTGYPFALVFSASVKQLKKVNTGNNQKPIAVMANEKGSHGGRNNRDLKLVNVFSLSVSGGVLHGSGPDVPDDSSVLSVRRAGGCVRVPGAVRRLLPHHDGPHSVRAGWTHASLTGHWLPSRPYGCSHDSRSTHRW